MGMTVVVGWVGWLGIGGGRSRGLPVGMGAMSRVISREHVVGVAVSFSK